MEHVNIIASLIIALAAALGCAATAHAQPYPSKPITLVVGFAPGGPTDTVARIIADHMKTTFGQTVVVENVGGAAGTIGAARVARAAPDGYTLNVGQWTSNVGGPAITPTPYHVLNDFEPVARLTTSYLWIVGRRLAAGDQPERADRVAQGQSRQGHRRDRRRRQRRAYLLHRFPDQERHEVRGRALQGRHAGAAGSGRRPGRHQLPRSGADHAAVPRRHGEGVRRAREQALDRRAGCADAGGRRIAGRPDRVLARPVGAQGHAEGYRRQAQRRGERPRSPIRRCASALPISVTRSRARELQSPQALFAHHKAELDRWWPVIKAAGIKAQ